MRMPSQSWGGGRARPWECSRLRQNKIKQRKIERREIKAIRTVRTIKQLKTLPREVMETLLESFQSRQSSRPPAGADAMTYSFFSVSRFHVLWSRMAAKKQDGPHANRVFAEASSEAQSWKERKKMHLKIVSRPRSFYKLRFHTGLSAGY